MTADQSAAGTNPPPAAPGDNTAERAANAATTPGDQNVTGADQSNDTAAADVNSSQDTTASSATTGAADQSTTASADTQAAGAGADQNAAADNAALPQTASPLPLLGLLGFGSTAVGAFLRRRK
jgi:hypothetical protein